ncbi:DUF2382 domain-containing protein [Calothrix sp. UHCC 0171]|uniref:DUF2382 domain-containing protein n=1 Tax=Calothrix sp. UHCC 0171 TaxID=3110245 RepID=UPI002B1EBD02|nr:DUF2382 domain-containing protein [Calothrix sp. UHCC 0171]MEA5571515.1 DUF2382 domain-containing protein [Calothrix sp. UHCC 0171]
MNSNLDNSINPDTVTFTDRTTSEPIETKIETANGDILRLLEERLIVDRTKQKVGEVVIRKEIETRMVTVPVRREILIVEQISPENKQLASIDLGGEEISGIELTSPEIRETINQNQQLSSELTVSGEFTSPKIASLLLNAIAMERHNGCKSIHITITVDDEEHQQQYQEWFARTSQNATGK